MQWYVFAFAAAIISSLAIVIEKKTLMKEHAMEFSAVVAIFNVVVSLLLIPFIDWNIPLNVLPLLYLISVLGTFAFWFVAKAMRHMEISLASPLLNLEPIFLITFAFFALGEKLSLTQISGILILIVCAYILETPKELNFKDPFKIFLKSKYIHYIVYALMLYSLGSIGDKIVLSIITPFTYIFIVQFFVAINFIVLISMTYDGLRGIKNGIKNYGKLIFLVAIFTTSYRLLQAQAVSMAYVSLVMPIRRLSSLFSVVIGGQIFRERRLVLRTTVCIIMIIAAYFIITG